MNWRKLEADMIRDYFFEVWMREYQEQETLERAERERYERARNAADRAADRY
jgi:hypothetical protein